MNTSINAYGGSIATDLPEQPPRLSLREIRTASVTELAAAIEADPSQKRQIEWTLIREGRSALLYDLARMSAVPKAPVADAEPDPAQQAKPGADLGDQEGARPEDATDALSAVDERTALRIERILGTIRRNISMRVWHSVASLVVAIAQSTSSVDEAWMRPEPASKKNPARDALSATVIGDRLVIQSLDGRGWSVDLKDEDAAIATLERAVGDLRG